MCLSKFLEESSLSGSIQNLKEEAERILKRLKRALIVFDDANDLEIQRWIVALSNNFSKGGCRCLVTTYNSSGMFQQETKIQVEKLDFIQARRLFLSLLPEDRQEQSFELMDELIAFCDGLPLAIHQAAAYISRTGISVEKFLDHLQADQIAGTMMDWDADGIPYSGMAHQGVYSTFKETYDFILRTAEENRDYQVCGKMLQFLAFLDPMCIDEDFFRSLDSDFGNEMRYNAAVSVALKFGLLERDDSIRMRGVVQQVIRQLMKDKEQEERLRAIVSQLSRRSLEIVAAQRDFDVMLPVFLHMSYIQPLKGYALISRDTQIADLYCLTAEFLFAIGDYDGSEKQYQKASEIGDRLSRLRTWTGLAILYENKTDYSSAQAYIQKVEQNENLFEEFQKEYPKAWMSYLEVKGYLSIGNDQPEQAVTYYTQFMEYLNRAQIGENQKQYKGMLMLNGMGMSYERMKQYDRAEAYYQKALEVGRGAIDGYDRVPVSMVLVIGNYGTLLSETGRLDEAENYLKMEEQIYVNWTEEWKAGFEKKNHMRLWQYFFADRNINDFIDYASNQVSLGNLYCRRNREGDMEQALSCMQRGKALLQSFHADTHSLMLNIDTFLCSDLYRRGFYDQAIEMGTSILDNEQKYADNDAAKNAKIRLCQYLSYSYQACRQYKEAVNMLKRALSYVNACTSDNGEMKAEVRRELQIDRKLLFLQKCRILK